MEISDQKPGAVKSSPEEDRPGLVPAIVFLSGRNRGKTEPLAEQTVFLGFNEAGGIISIPASAADLGEEYPVRLHRSGDTYELEVQPSIDVWVNGERTSQRTLASGEVIEIGRNGPMLRYRIYGEGGIPGRTAADAFSDCIDCARYADGSITRRTGRFMSAMAGELVIHTTPWVWFAISVVTIAMVAGLVTLSRQNIRLEQQLEARLARDATVMQEISEWLQRNEETAITGEDLAELREKLEQRVGALEARSEATKKIIASAARSIAFIQGSYGYRDGKSGKPLRYVGLDDNGQPLRTRLGPAVTLEGEGPVVELHYTGTAFVVNDRDTLVTNRHIAMPWENNPAHEQFTEMGLEPQFGKFIGYLPGIVESFNVELVAASEDADVAVLRCDAAPSDVEPLVIGSESASPGDEVIVMGYPTGVRAMLARTHSDFLEEIGGQENLDFWKVVEKLSKSGLITPLATRGIVGQVSADAVAYDADTTRGGSGGPVLNMGGQVIAVNAAILPEFGGSNLGVPISRVLPVLEVAAPGGQ